MIKWLEVNLAKISFKLHSSLRRCEIVLMRSQLFRKSQILISAADDKKELKDTRSYLILLALTSTCLSLMLPQWAHNLLYNPHFAAKKYKLSHLCNV